MDYDTDKALIRDLSPSDIDHVVRTQVETSNYRQPIEPIQNELVGKERTYHENHGIWDDIISQKLRSYTRVVLKDFHLFEWFPRSPGLYFTEAGALARREATQYIHVESSSGDSVVYNAYGKMMMLRGGVGTIRLRDRVIEEGRDPVWFVSASSTGICHQGFPVAIPHQFYAAHIDEITERGAVLCNLVGTLVFIPKRIDLASLYNEYPGVPQLYLLVEDLSKPQSITRYNMPRLGVSVAVSFTSGDYGEVLASYATFNPADKDSFRQRIEWMGETYVQSMYKGEVITDFDEQMTHFPGAVFSLKNVMDLQLDRKTVQSTLTEIHIHGDVDKLFDSMSALSVAIASRGSIAKITEGERTMSNTQSNRPSGEQPSGEKIYYVGGDIGAGAQVAQGEHIQQVKNTLAGLPDSDILEQQFDKLMNQIAQAPGLDDETRDLALEKTKAVAEGLANAKESPNGLSRALRDAKGFLTSSVKGAWEGLCEILKSEAAQKTISAIAEGATKAAIAALIGGA
jgi:hypothetical protein